MSSIETAADVKINGNKDFSECDVVGFKYLVGFADSVERSRWISAIIVEWNCRVLCPYAVGMRISGRFGDIFSFLMRYLGNYAFILNRTTPYFI